MPPNMYCTCVVHDVVVSWPTLSVAVRVTVFGPTVLVSIVTVPDGFDARPEWASLAVTVALAGPLSRTAAGHVTSSVGAVASTLTVNDEEPDSLPTESLTVDDVVC